MFRLFLITQDFVGLGQLPPALKVVGRVLQAVCQAKEA